VSDGICRVLACSARMLRIGSVENNAVITIAIRLRSDYDVSLAPASIRRDSTRAKNERVNFSS